MATPPRHLQSFPVFKSGVFSKKKKRKAKERDVRLALSSGSAFPLLPVRAILAPFPPAAGGRARRGRCRRSRGCRPRPVLNLRADAAVVGHRGREPSALRSGLRPRRQVGPWSCGRGRSVARPSAVGRTGSRVGGQGRLQGIGGSPAAEPGPRPPGFALSARAAALGGSGRASSRESRSGVETGNSGRGPGGGSRPRAQAQAQAQVRVQVRSPGPESGRSRPAQPGGARPSALALAGGRDLLAGRRAGSGLGLRARTPPAGPSRNVPACSFQNSSCFCLFSTGLHHPSAYNAVI